MIQETRGSVSLRHRLERRDEVVYQGDALVVERISRRSKTVLGDQLRH